MTTDLDTLCADIIGRNLTFLGKAKLGSLAVELEKALPNVEGDLVEFGMALGGSGILMALLGAKAGRRFAGYDVFGMIPPPSERDGEDTHKRYAKIAAGHSVGIKGEEYYGYRDDLYGDVVRAFKGFGLDVDGDRIRLEKGLFEDTVPRFLPEKIAFVHLDCDWFDPITYCLNVIEPHMAPGSILIGDDYSYFEGARKATDLFIASSKRARILSVPHHVIIQFD